VTDSIFDPFLVSQVPTQSQSLLKQPQTIYLTTRGSVFGQQQGRVVIPKLNIKVEPGTAGEFINAFMQLAALA